MEYFARLLLLVCLIFEAVQAAIISEPFVKPNPRILNGLTAATGQFPYQVSVRVGGQHSCGGTILSQNYIITVAHCVFGLPPHFVTVNAGSVNSSADGVVVEVSEIIPHPDFSYTDSDIALLNLNVPLQFTNLIKPIALAGISPPPGLYVTVSGWGRTSEGGKFSERLLYSRYFKTISSDECAKAIGYKSSGILCLSRRWPYGICGGDEGGPAVYNGILIGIASYHKVACGSDEPDGFTNISVYRKWLLDVTNALILT